MPGGLLQCNMKIFGGVTPERQGLIVAMQQNICDRRKPNP
jgi:hypothetical protein